MSADVEVLVVLHFRDGTSIAQLARRMGVSTRTIRRVLERADMVGRRAS